MKVGEIRHPRHAVVVIGLRKPNNIAEQAFVVLRRRGPQQPTVTGICQLPFNTTPGRASTAAGAGCLGLALGINRSFEQAL